MKYYFKFILQKSIKMLKTYRKGAAGALLDEYERAITDLKGLIMPLADTRLTEIADPETNDENCKSIQSILSHVVSAGFGYAVSIHNLKGHDTIRPEKTIHSTIEQYIQDIDRVFAFTEYVFSDIKDEELEQNDNALKICTSWEQVYDIEQLMEHAIVHILRHRRQIERIIQ